MNFLRFQKIYDPIIQKFISYKIESEFLFEFSLISLRSTDT